MTNAETNDKARAAFRKVPRACTASQTTAASAMLRHHQGSHFHARGCRLGRHRSVPAGIDARQATFNAEMAFVLVRPYACPCATTLKKRPGDRLTGHLDEKPRR